MKKSLKILTITMLLVMVMLVTLTGCSSTPYHKFLNTNWNRDKQNQLEVATYDYKYSLGDNKLNGTYVTKVCTTKNKPNFNIGDIEFTDVTGNGSYYEYELTVDNGDILFGQVYFKSTKARVFAPVASYTKRYDKLNNTTTETQIKYSEKTANITYKVNGVEKKLSTDISKNGLVFDNVQLEAITRTLNFTKQGSLNFETPRLIGNAATTSKVAIGPAALTKLNVPEDKDLPPKDKTFVFINEGKEFKAMQVVLTLNEQPAGSPIIMFVADGTFKIGDNEFTQPLIKITKEYKQDGVKGKSEFILKDMQKIAL